VINPLGPIAVIAIGRLLQILQIKILQIKILQIEPAIEPQIEAIALAGIAITTKGLQVTNVVGATGC
jgi:hypothetical protein